jgi:hypothetical protein
MVEVVRRRVVGSRRLGFRHFQFVHFQCVRIFAWRSVRPEAKPDKEDCRQQHRGKSYQQNWLL